MREVLFEILEGLYKLISSGVVSSPRRMRAKKPTRSYAMNNKSSCNVDE
jgi:hypothetical protein